MSKVSYMPVWKHGATVAERLYELAMIAEKYPEQFTKVAIAYEESDDEGNLLRVISSGVNTNELIGILEIAKSNVIRDSRV